MRGPIARGTIRTTFVLGFRLVIQAATLLLLAHLLGPEQFGAFVGVASLAVILGSLSTFGTQLVLLGEVSRDSQRRTHVLPYALPITLFFGSTLLLLYLLMAVWLTANTELTIQVLVFIGITEIILQPFFGLMSSEHHGLGRIAGAQLLQILPMALRCAIVSLIFSLHLNDPIDAYAMGYLGASLLALAIGGVTLPDRWPAHQHWRLPRRDELAEAAGYAAINFTKAAPAELDKTLALKLLPLGMVGIYAAGARVVAAVALPVTAMTLAALPRLFREKEKARSLLGFMYLAAFIYGLLLALALWLVSPVFDIIFGEKYIGVSEIVRWLCIAIPAMAIRLVAGNSLMALGRLWMRVCCETAGLVILIVASALLTGRYGAVGLPLALALSEWAMAIAGGVLVYGLARKSCRVCDL